METVPSRLHIHTFTSQIRESKVHFLILKLKESLFFWIGTADKPPMLPTLSLAVITKQNKALPAASHIIGDFCDLTSDALASKVAMWTGHHVYASYTLPSDNKMLEMVYERIRTEITDHPEFF